MTTRMQTVPGWFSEAEEEFFRAGNALAETVDTFEEPDADERPGLWRRLFGRRAAKR